MEESISERSVFQMMLFQKKKKKEKENKFWQKERVVIVIAAEFWYYTPDCLYDLLSRLSNQFVLALWKSLCIFEQFRSKMRSLFWEVYFFFKWSKKCSALIENISWYVFRVTWELKSTNAKIFCRNCLGYVSRNFVRFFPQKKLYSIYTISAKV